MPPTACSGSWSAATSQRELDGAYVLEPAADDADATEVAYELAVDLIIPIPGFVKRRAEGRIIKTALLGAEGPGRGLAPAADRQ